jgi:DNA invertase Pin-like site-specific DNA recombinase
LKLSNVTKEETRALRDRFGSDAKIADRLGVSRQSIYLLRKRHGIQSKRSMKAKKSRNRKIRNEATRTGVKRIELSRSFNLSVSQIYRILGENKHAAKNNTIQIR